MGVWTEPVTFAAAWRHAVRARGDAPFLTFEASDGAATDWTYAEFDRVVRRLTRRLVNDGAGPGAAVHLALTNSPTFVAAWLACTTLGAWIVPSDPMSTALELGEHMTRTGPSVGICAAQRSDVFRTACDGVTEAPRIIEVDEDDAELSWLPAAPLDDIESPSVRDRAAVMFTSGTTGRPKGVEITQANYAFAGAAMASAADLTPDDRQLVVLPMFHANAQYYSFASAIWVGASVALMSTFSASGFLPQAARHRATCASLFAGPMRMILARGKPVDDVALRHCWFAQNLAADQYATLSDWFGCSPRQLYGMTETIPAVLTDSPQSPRPDTMGYVTDGCAVRLVNGEIRVGGEPGITLFAGYLDDPGTTEASFVDGWFCTGDRAHQDGEGRYVFDGRRSDVLKVAGENVSVVEVEQVLCEHPHVLEAAVVGRPDPIRDEVPVAFVVPLSGIDRDDLPDTLARWCAERLGKAKRPHAITIVDELPRTSVGKIRKFLLKDGA
jgi:crotonobetaine/carnitine-CoA ligase